MGQVLAGRGDKQDPASGWKGRSGLRKRTLGLTDREEGQARVRQVPRAAGDLGSFVGGGRRGSCPEWGCRGRKRLPGARASLPGGLPSFLPAAMTGAGLRLRRRGWCRLPWLHRSSLPHPPPPPGSSPDLAPALPTGGSGHFSLPGCLELGGLYVDIGEATG